MICIYGGHMNIYKHLTALFLLILIAACSSNNTTISTGGSSTDTSDIFNIKTYNISKGDTIRLNYRKVDSSAGAVVAFSSNNLNIVQVNNNGEVTGISAGSAQVEISITTSGITQKDICTINVKDDIITYIGYASKELTMAVNETITPKLIILPESASDNTIIYTLKDYGVVDLNELTGAVTAKKTGSTVLTATVGKLSSSINITVKDSVKHVQSIVLAETSKTIYQGEKYKITPTISPSDADNQNVVYSSNNKNVAVVLPDGTVVGENPGNAIITVETVDGNLTAEFSITVLEATGMLESVEIGDIILEAGTSQFVNVHTTPSNAKYSGLKVTTYNDAVTVTPITRTTLLVTAKKQGYLTSIDVEAENCGQSDVATKCTGIFNTYTIDNETAKLPETLLTVEPYNIIQEDATNYKIKLAFDKNNKLYPLNAIKRYPSNSKVESTQWDILLPANSSGNQVLVKNSDNSVSAQGTGKAVISVGILGHDEVKPVIFDVDVVAKESQIPEIDRHCEISNIEIVNETDLKSKLSKIGALEFINANIRYNSGNRCGIPINDYNVETSNKNIIDIIDGFAYVKKTGEVTLTIVPNTMFNDRNIKKEIKVTVIE